MVNVRASIYKDLSGALHDNLSGHNATFYGLGLNGERRCLEEQELFSYEPQHDYRSGAITMRDGTRMATSSVKADEAGWKDLADIMRTKGL